MTIDKPGHEGCATAVNDNGSCGSALTNLPVATNDPAIFNQHLAWSC